MASADIGKKQGAKGFITSHYPIDELTLTWHILCSVCGRQSETLFAWAASPRQDSSSVWQCSVILALAT